MNALYVWMEQIAILRLSYYHDNDSGYRFNDAELIE